MAAESGLDQELITNNIKTSLLKAQKLVANRKKTNTRLLVASMALSGASTLVAGITSAGGPLIGSGIEGWRLACIVAAVLGFTSTISTGAFQQLESTDRLSNWKECNNRLRLLDLGIKTGNRSWEEITKEYEDLAITYPELIS